MASKPRSKRPANRGKAKSRGRRAAPEYSTSPLIRSVALVALGALVRFLGDLLAIRDSFVAPMMGQKGLRDGA